MINNYSWLCILALSAYKLKQMICASLDVYNLFILWIYQICDHQDGLPTQQKLSEHINSPN